MIVWQQWSYAFWVRGFGYALFLFGQKPIPNADGLKRESERGVSLFSECSAYLRELSDSQAEATPAQKQRILQKIKARHQD